jgi:hypothetical protein
MPARSFTRLMQTGGVLVLALALLVGCGGGGEQGGGQQKECPKTAKNVSGPACGLL